MKTAVRAMLPAIVGALTVLPASPAAAQEERADTLPVYPVEPLVVEVFRAPFVLERVPYAASVVEEEAIRRGKPGLSLAEALRAVPGVQVDNRHIYALGERISVRGFGARSQFGVRGARAVVDGIPATFPDGQSALEIVDPALLGRVEVIRGPASVLYGNAGGGVLSFRTPPPADVPLLQEYRAVGGADGLRRIESRLSGTTGRTSYRLGLSRLDHAGYREFSEAGLLRGNGQLGFALGGGELRLTGAFLRFDAQNPGALTTAELGEDPRGAAPMNLQRVTGKEGNQQQLGAFWTAPLAGGEVEVAGYGIHRRIRNPIVPFVIDLDRNAAGVRALYRGESALGDTRAGWTLGVDGDAQWDDRQNRANEDGETGALILDQRERVRSVAPFLHLSASPVADLHLMGGVRYDRFHFSVDDRFESEPGAGDSGSRVMSAWSPAVGVSYEWRPALGVYANLSTAFETPTTTELVNHPEGRRGFNPELEPQRTVSYEAGARGALGRAAYQLSVYRADVRNSLVPFEDPAVAGRTFFRNAGSAMHRGVEASGSLRGGRGLTALLSYTYTDAVFRSYVVQEEDFSGNRIPGVAPHRVGGMLQYETPGGLFLGLEGRHASATPVDDANAESAPAYTVFGARAGHDAVRVGRAEVSPFVGVENLTDRSYVPSVVPNAFGGRYYEPGAGRSVYLGAEVRLGADRR